MTGRRAGLARLDGSQSGVFLLGSAGTGQQLAQQVFAEAAAGWQLGIEYLQLQQTDGSIQIAFQAGVDQGRAPPCPFQRDLGVGLRLDARDLLGAQCRNDARQRRAQFGDRVAGDRGPRAHGYRQRRAWAMHDRHGAEEARTAAAKRPTGTLHRTSLRLRQPLHATIPEYRAEGDARAFAKPSACASAPYYVRYWLRAHAIAISDGPVSRLRCAAMSDVANHESGIYVRDFRPVVRDGIARLGQSTWPSGISVWEAETEGRDLVVDQVEVAQADAPERGGA